jgi:methionyl-tRNA synthetase
VTAQIHDAAAAAGESPSAFTDRVSGTFRSLFDEFDVSYTTFIRTTEDHHKQVCRRHSVSIQRSRAFCR